MSLACPGPLVSSLHPGNTTLTQSSGFDFTRAEIALDIFDEVIEGPEGDLVYAIFATDTPDYAQPPHSQYQTQPISVLDDSDDSATEEEEGDDAGDGVRKSGRSSGKKAKKVQEVIEISDDDDD